MGGLSVDDGGRCRGTLDAPNCRGPEKVNRLLARFGAKPDVLYAYGDSSGDRDLLALADHPQLVRRGEPLPAAPVGTAA